MMLARLNLGCGPHILSGWKNVDIVRHDPTVEYWNAIENVVPENWKEHFDFILINHVLCTMKPHDVDTILAKAREMLKEGGILQVIDMDMNKVYQAYLEGRIQDIPIESGTIDDRICFAISGYGTRLSLFTPVRMTAVLYNAGFRDVKRLDSSEYDLRPKESLIFEGIK